MCRVGDILRPEWIACRDDSADRETLVTRLAALLEPAAGVPTHAVVEAVKERERFGTTAIGHGVALPHCRIAAASGLLLAAATLVRPVSFDAPDGEGVRLAFLIVVPEGNNLRYLKLLSRMSVICGDRAIRERLMAARDAAEFLGMLKEAA